MKLGAPVALGMGRSLVPRRGLWASFPVSQFPVPGCLLIPGDPQRRNIPAPGPLECFGKGELVWVTRARIGKLLPCSILICPARMEEMDMDGKHCSRQGFSWEGLLLW